MNTNSIYFILELYVVNTNDNATNNYMIVLFDCGQNVVKRCRDNNVFYSEQI